MTSRPILSPTFAIASRKDSCTENHVGQADALDTCCRQPAGKNGPAHLGGHHQGAMGLRAGSPAAQRLGLDHFERRSWQGLHRHALMTMIAYAFLQHRRLAAARREKKNQRATASADFAGRAPRHPRTHRSTTTAAMPALPKMDLQRAAACELGLPPRLATMPTGAILVLRRVDPAPSTGSRDIVHDRYLCTV
jgi:hypothetical protein